MGAKTEYDFKISSVRQTLSEINTAIDEHQARQQRDSDHWGLTGDMGHVLNLLQEIHSFLSRGNDKG